MEYFYKDMRIKATAKNTTHPLKENTLEHFIVDRYVAFIKGSNTKTYQYVIGHRPWKLYDAKTIDTDERVFSMLPQEFKNAKPVSSYFVDGSSVTVSKGVLQRSTMAQNNVATAIH